jgi:hypothetical protein
MKGGLRLCRVFDSGIEILDPQNTAQVATGHEIDVQTARHDQCRGNMDSTMRIARRMSEKQRAQMWAESVYLALKGGGSLLLHP